MTKFVVNPLNAAGVPERATLTGIIFKVDVGKLELEIINTENDIVLQSYSKEKNFWKPVGHMKCPLLQGTVLRYNSCFGSTCLREVLFSSMKKIKYKHRPRLTGSHLNDCLPVTTLSYVPDFKVVVEEKQ